MKGDAGRKLDRHFTPFRDISERKERTRSKWRSGQACACTPPTKLTDTFSFCVSFVINKW